MNLRLYINRAIQYIRYGVPNIELSNNISIVDNHSILANRVALITGATGGIGKEIADRFLNSGANVILIGRNEQKLVRLRDDLRRKYPDRSIIYYSLDITDISLVLDLFQYISSNKYSELQPDILVNNAGIEGGHISYCSDEDYSKIMDTNLKGVFFLSKLFAEKLIEKNKAGNILNIASSSSYRPAVSAYMLSKWGLRGLTLGLAKMYIKHNIVVNGIAPGPTATPMMKLNESSNKRLASNPAGRYVEPIEVANAAVFLVSNSARMVVGDILCMTGGAGLITYDDVQY